jgi:IS30 family transposase
VNVNPETVCFLCIAAIAARIRSPSKYERLRTTATRPGLSTVNTHVKQWPRPDRRGRPVCARNARRAPGHCEGDLLFGSKNSQIATLVERQSRYVMLAKVDGKDTETVVDV